MHEVDVRQLASPLHRIGFSAMTELHEAASVGDLERVEEALRRGLDPNEADPEWGDKTPLHIAASKGFKKCVYVLLQAGASVNAVTTSGWTPAHFACETGQVGCLQSLISGGCDLSLTDESGDTPLHVARIYGQTECQDLIIDTRHHQKTNTHVK